MAAIVGGTGRVLASRGYAGTTTNHIVEAAGVSIGSLYQYFPDKDSAVGAFAEQFAEDILAFARERTAEAIAGPRRTAVRTWLRALTEYACERGPVIRVLFQEVPFVWQLPRFRNAMVDALAMLQQHVSGQNAVPAERVNDDRLLVMLTAMTAVIVQVASEPRLQARREPIVDELARMIESYLRALVVMKD